MEEERRREGQGKEREGGRIFVGKNPRVEKKMNGILYINGEMDVEKQK